MFVNLRLPWVLKRVTSVKAGSHLRIESGILTQTALLWFGKTIYAQSPSFLCLDERDMVPEEILIRVLTYKTMKIIVGHESG